MTARKRKHYEFEDTSQDGSESCAFQDPQSSIFKSQAAHQLCTRCASIDFNTVLPKEGWVRIRSIGMLADFVQEPECSVCQLFGSKARLIATNLVSGLKSYSERIYINYSLYAFSSFAIFGTNRPPPRGLSETKLFAILGEYGFGVDKSPHEPTIFGSTGIASISITRKRSIHKFEIWILSTIQQSLHLSPQLEIIPCLGCLVLVVNDLEFLRSSSILVE